MGEVCIVKIFYIAVRIGEEESWLSGYCGNVGKCNLVTYLLNGVESSLRS